LLNIKSLREATETDLLSIRDQISESEYQKVIYVLQENQRVLDAFDALKNNNIERFGDLLYASHEGMQYQYMISCEELDFLVNATKETDSILGSRMMGGGFGGCTINIIHKEEILKFSETIKNAYHEKFNTNCSFYSVNISEGTHIIEST